MVLSIFFILLLPLFAKFLNKTCILYLYMFDVVGEFVIISDGAAIWIFSQDLFINSVDWLGKLK